MLHRVVNRTAIVCISGYQKHLSPRKGFACAHRLLHREESCSTYIKRAIAEQGLWAAIPLSRRRFADCSVAAQVLRERHLFADDSDDSCRGRLRRGVSDIACDVPELCCDSMECSHCAAPDCSAVDCAGCACSPW